MVFDKPNSPSHGGEGKSENHRGPEVFMKQVEKLITVLVNSDDSEILVGRKVVFELMSVLYNQLVVADAIGCRSTCGQSPVNIYGHRTR